MPDRDRGSLISRRDALRLGGVAGGALLAACAGRSQPATDEEARQAIATAQAEIRSLRATVEAMQASSKAVPTQQPTVDASQNGGASAEAGSDQASASAQAEASLEAIPEGSRTPETLQNRTFDIQAWSTMKLTKDRVCNQPTVDYIEQYALLAKASGATHLTLEVPLVDPMGVDENNVINCNGREVQAFDYLLRWINAARSNDLQVIIRPPLIGPEGIYNHPKNPDLSQSQEVIRTFYSQLPQYLQKGDVVLLPPEPQNYGIKGSGNAPGYTDCNDQCAFESADDFNEWLRQTGQTIRESLGKTLDDVTVGCCGLEGFTTIGYQNGFWEEQIMSGAKEPILQQETIDDFGGVIWIDHYPPEGLTMADFLTKFNQKYPNAKIVIGEFGDTNARGPEYVRTVLQECADNPSVVGFTYWHGGPGGNEALLTQDLIQTPLYTVVQEYFTTNKRP